MNSNTDQFQFAEPNGMTSASAEIAQDVALLKLGCALKKAGYRFTTITPATHARVNARDGNEWAIDLGGVFGWSRPFDSSVLPEEIFALMRIAGIVAPHDAGWRCLLRASTLDDQLFFHSAYPTEEVDSVFFGPDTYRFATAIGQHLGVTATPVQRAVDIGCGGGPGAISIAHYRPEAEVLAVDINDSALRLARVNAALAGAGNVKPCVSNLLNDVDGTFDLIVANPPYLVDPERRAYRHGAGALGEGLSLSIVDCALQRLRSDGTLLLYTGAAVVDGIDAFRLAAEQKLSHGQVQWQYREIDPDIFGEELVHPAYAKVDRIAAVLLVVTKCG
jgi:methylase of polypeptide subunit release factors